MRRYAFLLLLLAAAIALAGIANFRSRISNTVSDGVQTVKIEPSFNAPLNVGSAVQSPDPPCPESIKASANAAEAAAQAAARIAAGN
jgi:hypothetical protein